MAEETGDIDVDAVLKRIADRQGITVGQLKAKIRDMANAAAEEDEIVEIGKNPKQTLFDKICGFIDRLDNFLFGDFRSNR